MVKKKEEIEQNIPIWVQFIMSGTIVSMVAYLAKNVSYKYSSILYSLPYTFLILLTIYNVNKFPRERIRKFAFNVIVSLSNIMIYSISFYILANKNFSSKQVIIYSFIPWGLFSLIMYYEPYKAFVEKYIL